MLQDIIAKDGEYEIVYSNTFNIYEKKLTIILYGVTIDFIFERDPQKEPSLKIEGTEQKSKVTLINMDNNPLGIGTIKRHSILTLSDDSSISFSLYTKSLNDSTSYLQVSITFYKK